MRRTVLMLCALLSLFVSGCSVLVRATLPPPNKPQVDVRDGVIVVVPEPLGFKARTGEIPIIWSLPQWGDLSFPPNGIVVEGEIVVPLPIDSKDRQARESIVVDRQQKEIVNCEPIPGGKKFRCLNRNTRPGVYKYTIRVLQNGVPLRPLDPTLMNY